MSRISALEYARSHGLAFDHTADDLWKTISRVPLTLTKNETELPDLDFSLFANELSDSKIQLDRQGGALLAKSTRDPLPGPHAITGWDQFLPERSRVRKLKIEEPLLTGDHETDVRRFRRDASGYLHLSRLLEACVQLGPSPDHDFDDEWNDILCGGYLRKVEREILDEKGCFTKDTLVYLSNALRNAVTEDQLTDALDESLLPVKRRRTRSPTPLLSPMEMTPEPSNRSPNVSVPLPCESDVDLDGVLNTERGRGEGEQIQMERECSNSPTQTAQKSQDPCNELAEGFGEDIQADSRSPSHAGDEAVTLPSLLEGNIEDAEFNSEIEWITPSSSASRQSLYLEQSSTCPSPIPLKELSTCVAARPEDSSFQEAFASVIDQEQFLPQPSDHKMGVTIRQEMAYPVKDPLKVPVLQLEQMIVNPPWTGDCNEYLNWKPEDAPLIATSPAGQQRAKDFNWQPIPPSYANVGVEDNIHDDGKAQRWVEPPKFIVESKQILCKKPGLRLLDTEDESDGDMEEDDELVKDTSKAVISSVPTKRSEDWMEPLLLAVKKSCMRPGHDSQRMSNGGSDPQLVVGCFSASNALDSFLDLRGGKFKRTSVTQTSVEELTADPIELTQVDDNNDFKTQSVSVKEASRVQVPSTPTELECNGSEDNAAQTSELKWPRTVVIETAILQKHCALVSFLEKSGGDQLNVIYREMGQQIHVDNISTSPDMIINPRAALIISNFQALGQKNLPGKGSGTGHSMIQSRILKLCENYDQLYILITTSWSKERMFPAQIDMMTAFAGFCGSLCRSPGSSVVPIFLKSDTGPRSSDETLNNWIWKLVCRHAFPETRPSPNSLQAPNLPRLINDETLWENFLRTVGLNPMAAQIVLEALKKEKGPSISRDQSWGLRRYVQLEAHQRGALFGGILGSRKTGQINSVLDMRWK